MQRGGAEKVAIVAELTKEAYITYRRARQPEEVGKTLRELQRAVMVAVSTEHEVFPEAFVAAPDSIPKTSSGKKQRHALKRAFVQGNFEPLGVAPPRRGN